VDQGRSQQLAANVMFGVGVLTAATGIGLFLWDTFREEDSDSAFPIGPSGPVEAAAPRPTPDTAEGRAQPDSPAQPETEPKEPDASDEDSGGDGINLLD
jgi:hypothetical protein